MTIADVLHPHKILRDLLYDLIFPILDILLNNSAKLLFVDLKISCLPVTQKVSTIEHIEGIKTRVLPGGLTLHNTHINVAIAHILLYQNSLYDLHKPR